MNAKLSFFFMSFSNEDYVIPIEYKQLDNILCSTNVDPFV